MAIRTLTKAAIHHGVKYATLKAAVTATPPRLPATKDEISGRWLVTDEAVIAWQNNIVLHTPGVKRQNDVKQINQN